MADVLGMGSDGGSVVGMGSLTGGGIVASLSAIEAATFTDTFGTFDWGEFRETDVVDVHGIGISLWSDECGSRLRAATTKGLDTHLLCMESFGLFNPIVNHGGDSLVYTKGKLINENYVISDGGIAGKILKIGDILLETIIDGSIEEVDGLLDKLE